MSDRLAVSASLSVLMMSIFVLFGTEPSPVLFTTEGLRAPAALTGPAPYGEAGRRLHFLSE